MALMECPECKKNVSTQAMACPNCGCPIAAGVVAIGPTEIFSQKSAVKKVAAWKTFLGLFVLLVVIAIIISKSSNNDDRSLSQPVVSTNVSGTATAEAPVPNEESAFISTINSFEARYGEATNEFQKSSVRQERAHALASMLLSRSVDNWVGQISSMATNSDGNGVLSVTLAGSQIKVETWNNGLSDIEDNTLISHGSMVYNQVSNLSTGDTVFFSGRFASGNLDYIKESSLTEAGSMNEPDFIFTFTSVQRERPTLPEKPNPIGMNTSLDGAGAALTSEQSGVTTPPAMATQQTLTAVPGASDKTPETSPTKVSLSQTSEEVQAILGPPASVTLGANQVYNYPHLRVVFANGRVSAVYPLGENGEP